MNYLENEPVRVDRLGSEIDREMERLTAQLDRLAEMASHLNERLQQVMAPPSSQSKPVGTQLNACAASPLGNALGSCSDRVNQLNALLESIHERLAFQ